MKAICAFCGHANHADAQVCSQCGGSLADAPRERFRIPWASWVPAIPLAALLWFEYSRFQQNTARTEEAFNTAQNGVVAEQKAAAEKLQAEFAAREKELEAKQRAMLADAKLISGEEAKVRQADEWQHRQNHDPALAVSVMEKTLLEVERLGKDPALTSEAALQKVAELVTPEGSRIEVTKGDHGFIVRVAFRLSAVDPTESGGATRHTSAAEARKEIEEVTARVIKYLFEYTGARGIQRVSVSCNRALVTGPQGSERLAMRSLFRASVDGEKAATVSNWRNLSVGQVEALMNVEHDGLATLIITKGDKPGLTLDPNEPLEF